MKRKKWTPKTEVTGSLLKFREKRKWQLAFRRYVVEQMPNPQYAPYFGLPINDYRRWIEIQFTEGISWENFGKSWQFDHIVPVTYFDYSREQDLRLCWNFINIRIDLIDSREENSHKIEVLAAKAYFENLHKKTAYDLCLDMLSKIRDIEISNLEGEPIMENFIVDNMDRLKKLSTLSTNEFNQLNSGSTLEDVILEKEMLKKFGS